MDSFFNIYVTVMFAGLLILPVGYASRHPRIGPALMGTGVVILLAVVVYYIATVLA